MDARSRRPEGNERRVTILFRLLKVARGPFGRGGSVINEPDPDETEDGRLFRAAVRGVKPLGKSAPVPKPRPPAARARFARADRYAVLRESLESDPDDPALAGGEELVFHRDGI